MDTFTRENQETTDDWLLKLRLHIDRKGQVRAGRLLSRSLFPFFLVENHRVLCLHRVAHGTVTYVSSLGWEVMIDAHDPRFTHILARLVAAGWCRCVCAAIAGLTPQDRNALDFLAFGTLAMRMSQESSHGREQMSMNLRWLPVARLLDVTVNQLGSTPPEVPHLHPDLAA
jgi:hypothetical protein